MNVPFEKVACGLGNKVPFLHGARIGKVELKDMPARFNMEPAAYQLTFFSWGIYFPLTRTATSSAILYITRVGMSTS
jgi:hypothetical protein